MNNENQLEYDIDKEMLQRHAVTVLEGLGAAVESLEESDFLNSVLISIGQTHVQRHVKPNMLRVGHLNLQFFNISKMRLFNLYHIMFLLFDIEIYLIKLLHVKVKDGDFFFFDKVFQFKTTRSRYKCEFINIVNKI